MNIITLNKYWEELEHYKNGEPFIGELPTILKGSK